MKLIVDKRTLKEVLDYESKKYNLKKSTYPFIAIREEQILYRFNFLLRKLEYYTNTNKKIMKIIFKLFYLKLERKYSIFLPINVFDRGLKLIHIGPRLVNGNSNVGKNFIMHVNTGLVAGGVNDDVPKIGNDCILGVGSLVIGNAILGDNIAVGAGAVVNKSFSEGNMTIAGVPAKKISNKTREDWSRDRRKNIN